ncbi:hypothetical protein [Embleya hyalina]|nr:hypothetical protein [Embleya hyalina]
MSENLADLANRCRAADGLLKVSLREMREELGYGKLGKWVLVALAEALQAEQIGSIPLWILDPRINDEPRQEQTIWLYDIAEGSGFAQAMEIAADPTQYEDSAIRDVYDRLVVDEVGMTAEQKLARIRRLCDS